MDKQIDQYSFCHFKQHHSSRSIYSEVKSNKKQYFRNNSIQNSEQQIAPLDTQRDEDTCFFSQPINQCFERVLDRKHSIKSNLGSIKELSISGPLELPQDTNEQHTLPNTASAIPQSKIRNRRKLKRLPRMKSEEPPKVEGQDWVFMPNNKFKQTWDTGVFCILIYVSVFTPFKIGFVADGQFLVWDYLDNAIDFLFMTDIILTFFSAAYDDEGNLITSRSEIVRNYLRGWFFVDLMSSIPFYLILNDASQRYNSIARISKVPKIYRIVKMIKLARMLRLKEIEYAKVININIGSERFILAFILLIFSCHVVGCIWFFVASMAESEEWIYLQSSTFDQYVVSVYWAVQTVLTVGYGDVKYASWPTRLFAVFWMLSSVYVFSFAVGSLASFLDRMDQNNQIYMLRLATLKNIKREFKIPLKMFQKVKRELKNVGRNFPQQFQTLLEELPPLLKTELSYIMNRHLRNEIGYFHEKSQTFISTIGPLLKPIKLEANEYVYQAGDHAEEIYFVKSGKLAIVLPEHQNFKFMMIKPGSYFGELDILFYGDKRRYTIMTTKVSEFYVLSRKDFKSVYLHQYREEGQILINEAMARKELIKRAYDEALQFLGEDQMIHRPHHIHAISPQVDPQRVIAEQAEEYNPEDVGVDYDTIRLKKQITMLEKQIRIKDQIISGIQNELDELTNQIQHQINHDILNRLKISKQMEEMLQNRISQRATQKLQQVIESKLRTHNQ